MTTNRSLVLLRTLRRSTSAINTIKHSGDKKRRSKAIGSIVGSCILYVFLLATCILINIGFGLVGLSSQIPLFSAMVLATMSFMFTLLKSNGYFYGIRDYDLLMSFPFEIKDIIKCKFICMFIDNLWWAVIISMGTLIGYGIIVNPPVYVYVLWIVLSLFLPIIPMAVAAALGSLMTGIGSGFKFKKAIQTILMFVFMFVCFTARFFIEAILKNNSAEAVMNGISSGIDNAAGVLFFTNWFKGAIVDSNIADMLLLVGVSLLVFAAFYKFVSISYKKINTRLRSHASIKNFKLGEQKKRSVIKAIAFKEFRRMTESTNYIVNATFGHILIVIFALVSLFLDADSIVGSVTKGALTDSKVVIPLIPFIVYFFVGMVKTTCISPSIEGKNHWILQSFPVKKMDIYKGKMLFDMYLSVPVAVPATIILCIKFGGDAIVVVLSAVLALTLCCFSTVYGLVWGTKFLKLDWENELEVIKQSTAVAGYLLTNMFGGIILMAGIEIGSFFIDIRKIEIAAIFVFALLTWIIYKSIERKAQKQF